MGLLKRQLGAHLSDAAKKALTDIRPYPSVSAIRNPLTRQIARRIAESDWRATHEQIDFGFDARDVVLGGAPCVVFRPHSAVAAAPVLLYLHAGAFIAGSARANASAVLPTCHLSGCEAIAVDYSLAPEATYPTQAEEIEAVYRALIAEGRRPESIIIIGDSAGGALVLSSIYRWRRLGLPMPAGAVLLSPFLDAEAASDTHHTLRGRDPLFSSHGRESCHECFRLYAGKHDVSDPEISPLNGDPAGLPPVLVHVGTREIMLGEAARFAEKARRAGVDTTLRVFDGMFHLFHQHWGLAEVKIAHQDIAAFIARVAR